MVTHHGKIPRTTFRQLPAGQPYWLATGTGVAPSMKHRRRAKISGYSTTTGALTVTAVADGRVGIVRVPGVSGSFGSLTGGNSIGPGSPSQPVNPP